MADKDSEEDPAKLVLMPVAKPSAAMVEAAVNLLLMLKLNPSTKVVEVDYQEAHHLPHLLHLRHPLEMDSQDSEEEVEANLLPVLTPLLKLSLKL